jgi:hypothetical protein
MKKLIVAFRNFANAPKKNQSGNACVRARVCVCVCVCGDYSNGVSSSHKAMLVQCNGLLWCDVLVCSWRPSFDSWKITNNMLPHCVLLQACLPLYGHIGAQTALQRELRNVIGTLKSDKDLCWEVRQHGKQNFLWTKDKDDKIKPQTNSTSFCSENKFCVPCFCLTRTRNISLQRCGQVRLSTALSCPVHRAKSLKRNLLFKALHFEVRAMFIAGFRTQTV